MKRKANANIIYLLSFEDSLDHSLLEWVTRPDSLDKILRGSYLSFRVNKNAS